MKRYITLILMSLIFFAGYSQQSTRKERNYIIEGNNFYNNKQYKNAIDSYNLALAENPSSQQALYNRALAMINLGSDANLKDEKQREQYMQEGIASMESISKLSVANPDLSSKANYNLGNVAFNTQDYKSAIEFYKQSLRLNPKFEEARRNLRIAQKKLSEQNGGGQDNKEDEQQQEQEENKENEQQQQQPQQPQQPEQQQQEGMSNQTAEQILNAIENKEQNTRQRMQVQMNRNKNEQGSNYPRKRW